MEEIIELLNSFNTFDLIYLLVTLWCLFTSYKKGFVLSIFSSAKWLLAYVITLYLFPKTKPFVKNIIDNEYVLDIILGLSLFVIIIFIILLINKGIKRAVTYSGLGLIDKFFGFLFGFAKAYIVVVCIFSAVSIIYNHEKWPMDLDKSLSYRWVEKGSNYLIKEFPNERQYNDTRETIQEF